MKLNPLSYFRKEKRDFTRVAQRFGCQIDGSLMMIDRMMGYEGRVINFSAGGAMFRPKLVYLMDRRDIPVALTVGGEEMFGRIMRTTPDGFGIRFDEPLEEEQLLAMLSNDRTRKESDDIEFFVD
ncbi:PilZ domain-containing protein [Sphingobium fluviale]|nr:PilZ domain-containing protein [Sphingobium fluviale]